MFFIIRYSDQQCMQMCEKLQIIYSVKDTLASNGACRNM